MRMRAFCFTLLVTPCFVTLLWLINSGAPLPAAEANDGLRAVGVAKADITPAYNVRLSGYGNRREESEGAEQRIWAKALAFGTDAEGPAVVVTVDNCGIPDAMRAAVLDRLAAKAGIKSGRFAISFSHTHCAPCLAGALVNIFSTDVPPEHQANIDRYSKELTDKLEQVVLAALADRKPARVSWAVGEASFARNRRAAWGGPVDHALPVMFVHGPGGELRAVFANYACHATTLSFNKIHGDWPGTAMEAIERDHPGAVALIGIGCGADQNPHPRGTVELAVQHGEEIGREVTRLLQSERKPLSGAVTSSERVIALPLDPSPPREELEKLAAGANKPLAYASAKNLALLDRGGELPREVSYRVQVWNLGDDLAMVFLPGEVTVDYQLRLKTEFDAARLWVNAYSNAAPCYIPSRRVLTEGGYEGMTAMVYYNQPAKFASGVEERVIGAVHELMPKKFAAHYQAEVPPRSPADSLAAIKTHENLVVELAAAEPFVIDPVAIDWDARGRMWVVEQPDYPAGMDGNWKAGGRVKILTDTDGDGRYDKHTLLLEGIPFPTGITCWRGGALVCAAPDILYAEDTNDDGKADKVEKLFSGFYTDNYNARINSLALGLDNWVHGANGLLGGSIRGVKTGKEVDIRGRDVRLNPDTGELQLVSGVTQQGRARDDWDNWFGCSNSRWVFHFPLPDNHVKRNPHVPAPPPNVYLPEDENSKALQAISKPLERFNHPEAQGSITSACGLGIYRDVLLGEEYAGNVFIGETAHNLVRRYRLVPKGATFDVQRPASEKQREFLASEDHWARPVQIRTGPDGALYVVDMYRAVIEHTRWIPADRLAKLDPRAGETMGRIYRVFPRGVRLRPVVDLTKLQTTPLVAALNSPNGTTRDLVHQLLLHRNDPAAREPLTTLAVSSKLPSVRVQALSVLDGMGALSTASLLQALGDVEAQVRRHAVRLCETRIATQPDVAEACLKRASDPIFTVRYQLAITLGAWNDPRAAAALGSLARSDMQDKWMRAAIVASSAQHPMDVLAKVMEAPGDADGRSELIGALVATAAAVAAKHADFEKVLEVLAPRAGAPLAGWQLAGMVQLQSALDRRNIKLASIAGAERVRPLFEEAHEIAANEKARVADREAAVQLFGRGFNDPQKDLVRLAGFLKPNVSNEVQKAALLSLRRSSSPQVAEAMLADWTQRAPTMRASIITTLLARDAWTQRLLQAVEEGTVHAAEVPAASRQTLAQHPNAGIRERSQKLLPVGGTAARASVLAKYGQAVPGLKGDAVKGATVFKNVCFVCHTYIGQGLAVGPDLKAFYNKSAADFVTAILDPNTAVEPRYAGYVVATKDGRMITGVVSNETATSLEVVAPGGIRENIVRGDIKEIRATGISLMPEGLEQGMTPQDVADLIAYLKSGG
jgi:putative membrane-bound dehydrogenase-like protein